VHFKEYGMSWSKWLIRFRKSAAPRTRRRRVERVRPRCEAMEDWIAPAAFWQGYAGNPEHTAQSAVASQPLDAIHWEAQVDLDPQYSGSDLSLVARGSQLGSASQLPMGRRSEGQTVCEGG
jgi:hypothetical protein